MVGYHQTNQKTDTGKTLTRWPVLVDHNNGAWIGAEQNQRGVSLFQVAYTYNSMNPISRIGYTFMLKKNHALVEGAGEVKKSLDSMSSE